MFLNNLRNNLILQISVKKILHKNTPINCVRLCSQNVDLKDVERHGSLSEKWWDANGPLLALHSMNSIRVPFIRDGLISSGLTNKSNQNSTKVLDGIELLEVGCGGGILTESLALLNCHVTGIDPGEEVIRIAKNHLLKSPKLISRVNYKIDVIEEFSKNNHEKYDAVVISEVLEHVINKSTFLSACVSVLKPGGLIFITTFNKTRISYITGVFMAENIFNIIPKNTHDWNNFIPPQKTQKLLEEFGCTTTLINGIFYEFWNNSWKFIENNDIHYALQAVKR